MNKEISYERVLTIIAIILCAIIIGYNAFFIPDINIPAVIYVDDNTNISSENDSYSDDKITNLNEDDDVQKQAIVNINTASASELEQISGIGPVIAQKIVEYRENVSPFESKEDIKNVSGIGDKIYEKIQNNIVV